MSLKADIGIFGGSGFYKILDNVREVKVETPYGMTSDMLMLAEISGKNVVFLPRHGRHHMLPPHLINYRANVWAMKSMGVKCVIGPCAAGSLQEHIRPGDFVVVDQFVDRTKCRKDTFFDGPIATHVSPAETYCPDLRKLAVEASTRAGVKVHDGGTVVVIEGPRFSTKAESKWFTAMGWDVINMTQYPEGYLARELEMCYVCLALITDYDAGLLGANIQPVTTHEIMEVFNRNLTNLRIVLFDMLEKINLHRPCDCHSALAAARFDT